MLMTAAKIEEWTAVCVSPPGAGRSVEIKIRFKDEVPRTGARLPLPAGFGLYANGRKHVASVATEVYVDAAISDLETVSAWLKSAEARVPANIVSFEITARDWKMFRRGAA